MKEARQERGVGPPHTFRREPAGDRSRCRAGFITKPPGPSGSGEETLAPGDAIDLLDSQSRHSRKGFFLQIEGASIDKQDHAANPCGQIGEHIEFDNAVKASLEYARHHKDTLVVVTADHGHTSQIVPLTTDSPGQTATLITADGAQMKINYATTKPGVSQEHTGTEVRIAAPQAASVVGITDQTDLFRTMSRALDLAH